MPGTVANTPLGFALPLAGVFSLRPVTVRQAVLTGQGAIQRGVRPGALLGFLLRPLCVTVRCPVLGKNAGGNIPRQGAGLGFALDFGLSQ